MRKPLFFTPGGWLTRYSLACGYIECVQPDDSPGRITLRQEHGTYIVNDSVTGGRRVTTDLLEARAVFTSFVKALPQGAAV